MKISELIDASWDMSDNQLVRIINTAEVKTKESYVTITQLEWLKYKKYTEVVRPLLRNNCDDHGYVFETEDGKPQV